MNRRRNKKPAKQSPADNRNSLTLLALPCRLAPTARFGLSIAALLVIYLGVVWINRGYAHAEVVPFPVPLNQLPTELGNWKGVDRELDDRVFRSLNAADQVSRSYFNAQGDEVSVHVATWQDYDGLTPHLPQVCLQGAGYSVGKEQSIAVEDGPDVKFTVRMVETRREREQIEELYWYQVGDHAYTDRTGGKVAQRQLWSREKKPAIVKVLLATPNLSGEPAREQLSEVAGLVRQWLASADASRQSQ